MLQSQALEKVFDYSKIRSMDSPGIEPGASPVRGVRSADELRALGEMLFWGYYKSYLDMLFSRFATLFFVISNFNISSWIIFILLEPSS